MTRSNLLIGAGVVVALLVLAFFLFQALDSDPTGPESGATSTTIGSDTGTSSTTVPSASSTSTTTSTTIALTTTTVPDGTPTIGGGGGSGSGGGGGNGGGGGGTTTPTTTTTPIPPNQPPVANSQAVAVVEDGPAVPITLTASDPQGTPLAFEVASSPDSGVLSGTAPN
ncbi:MAG: hypothetical protein ACRDXF_04180, partial [Acidimicrobiia bacterium]